MGQRDNVRRNITLLGALISFLPGCQKKTVPPASLPEKPGASIALHYPVLLIGERNLIVKDDETSLITTSVASGGIYYGDYVFLDSSGAQYKAKRATSFGRKAAWLDMGTSQFQVFLELEAKGLLTLKQAKERAIEAAIRPYVDAGGADQWIEIAKSKIGAARSYPELIEACRDPYRN
jgi:hypothetical protein